MSADSPARELKDKFVLVVEDNVLNYVLISRILGSLGINCEWKTTGKQLVETLESLEKIDLILMDIRLPYEDGYSAFEKIRQSEKHTKTLVVAITAEASPEQMKKARQAGFNGFIGKPIEPDRFIGQITRILSGGEVWEWS
ncbi:MAG: response regulator [Anaerolineae bacterium]|nr:response regulator [Anaerolineae bacterium]